MAHSRAWAPNEQPQKEPRGPALSMTWGKLILRSLRFHARAHCGVLAGTALAATALTGALIVGDSLRHTLVSRALARLGAVTFALNTPDRFFLDDMGRGPQLDAQGVRSVALSLPGTVSRQDGTARANRVNILGVEPESWAVLADWGPLRGTDAQAAQPSWFRQWQAGGSALVNQALADQLALRQGDELVVRFRKPTALSQDAVIAPRDNASALRVKVERVLGPKEFGDFSLLASQVPPPNLFLPLAVLQNAAGISNRANVLLTTATAKPVFEKKDWRLEDAQLSLSTVQTPPAGDDEFGSGPVVELSSSRIFLEPQVVQAALRLHLPGVTHSTGVLTYLANLLETGDRATPYSMVTAARPPYVPADMADDEILLNEWLARDLQARPGDLLRLSYYLADSGPRLTERTNVFKVRAIVPLKGVYADRSLMPEFPGLAKAESTHDWDAGFPLTYAIRPQDEAYWKEYRGTPKALVTLAAGQAMWSNRFGSLTSIRWRADTHIDASALSSMIRSNLQTDIDPSTAFGFRFTSVREQGLKAATEAQDFGQLFLGFSSFLIISALLLTALLFQFSLEQRHQEIGTFLALGFAGRRVRALFLTEGAALGLAGSIIGGLAGIGYAKAMLWLLVTRWHNAVGTSVLQFHASPSTLATGIGVSTAVAIVTIWLVLRKQARQPAAALLSGSGASAPAIPSGRRRGKTPGLIGWLTLLPVLAGVALVVWAASTGAPNPGAFFGAGALFLIAGVAWVRSRLSALRQARGGEELSFGSLGLRAAGRKRSRSVATVALLASGAFLIVSVGAFRLDANLNASRPGSGTGGFALMAEAALPVHQDLNTRSGREALGLGDAELTGTRSVPFRVRPGDDASCLNLNRAQQPRLLGVAPALLKGRFTFTGAAPGFKPADGWNMIIRTAGPTARDEVAAIGDANSVEWALGKKIGDTIDYTDESGRAFKIRIAGTVANSILQGNLIIDEAQFLERFPTQSGYRFFLLDAPTNSVSEVAATLTRALQDYGVEVVPAAQRLNQFNAVQNTYLGTFQVLGGLGLLLGSAGLGVVVLRNVLERRGELALLVACGFRAGRVRRLLLLEHGVLLIAGLVIGVVAALVAILPALLTPGGQFPIRSLAWTLAGVLVNGALWTWIATRFALRGPLLEALRNE